MLSASFILQAVLESDDDDIHPHVQHEHAQADVANATAHKSDFSFAPIGAAAGPRIPTLKFSGTPGVTTHSTVQSATMPHCCGVSYAVCWLPC